MGEQISSCVPQPTPENHTGRREVWVDDRGSDVAIRGCSAGRDVSDDRSRQRWIPGPERGSLA
jgi:hypothetical protein